MFSQANSLTGISARNWKVPEDLYNWIYYWTIYSTPVESIDVSNWDLSNVKKTNFMFTDIKTPVKII
jgi:surface protein